MRLERKSLGSTALMLNLGGNFLKNLFSNKSW